MAGFEPAHDGVKVRCLTTWRHPNVGGHGAFKPRQRRGLKKRMGWVKGFEPSASRATIWRANQLRHTHHIHLSRHCTGHVGLPERPGTPEGTRTPDLLLRRQLLYPTELLAHMERVMGIEPTRPAWKAGVLPLNYTRIVCVGRTDAISLKIISHVPPPVKGKAGLFCFFRSNSVCNGRLPRNDVPRFFPLTEPDLWCNIIIRIITI